MSWRDLKPLPDDWYEMERPAVSQRSGHETTVGGEVRLYFNDDLSREWFAEWLRSKRGWEAFTAWVDERR
jgi:hypothetical protein